MSSTAGAGRATSDSKLIDNVSFMDVFEFGVAQAADTLTKGFEGYFVPIRIDAVALLGMARSDTVDLLASRVAVVDGEGVAVALIARRGWTSRLAGMSACPDFRREGAGSASMRKLVQESAATGAWCWR